MKEDDGEKKGRKEWRGEREEWSKVGKEARKKRENERIKREKKWRGRKGGKPSFKSCRRETLAVSPQTKDEAWPQQETHTPHSVHICVNQDPHSDPTFNTGLLLRQKPVPPTASALGKQGSLLKGSAGKGWICPEAETDVKPTCPLPVQSSVQLLFATQEASPAHLPPSCMASSQSEGLLVYGFELQSLYRLLFLENPSLLGSPRNACQLFICQINHLPFQMPSPESV